MTALPVLTYHSIDTSGSPVSTAPGEFKRQIETLAQSGWRTLSLAAALEGLASGSWPRRSLLLTFDDGYASVGEKALPILSACGFTAILFAISGRVGSTNQWPGQPSWVPMAPLLDWPDLRALADRGWSLGAHSRTHARLTRIGREDARDEIVASRHEIEDGCGVAVESFAYPYGDRSSELEREVASAYRAAFGTRLAYVTARSRPTCLDRIDAFYLQGMLRIDRLDSRSKTAYFAVRRLLRSARRAVS